MQSAGGPIPARWATHVDTVCPRRFFFFFFIAFCSFLSKFGFKLFKKKKGDAVTISERYFVVLDSAVEKETVEYILARPTQMGSILLSGKVLQIGDTITRDVMTRESFDFPV